MVHRYAELKPHDLARIWETNPLAIVPWGALEWHGAHLPLGLDGIVAELFAERLAEESGGVLLPCLWSPMTTLPHRFSLQIATATFRSLSLETITGLCAAGARKVAIVTGHYAHGHHIELCDTAMRAIEAHADLLVLVGTPLEPLGDPSLLDHAARFETSQLLALRPELVDLSVLPDDVGPKADAVIGEDPRIASAEEGERLLREALNAWKAWIEGTDRVALQAHYEQAKSSYDPYVSRHFKGSWEQAIQDWWDSK